MSRLFQSLTGFELLDPRMLWILLLVPVVLWLRRRRGGPALRFAAADLMHRTPAPELERDRSTGRLVPEPPSAAARSIAKGMPVSLRTRLLPLPLLVQVLGLVLLAVALARPVYRAQLPFETEGIDILLVLDASSSMTANDMDRARTRLDVAKDSAAKFIDDRADDRIGLVLFARYPDLRCPPTLDHEALKKILSEVRTVDSEGPEDATGIGTAVARAAQALRGSDSKSKVVILLTDGEENVASTQTPKEIAPLHAAQLCEKIGVRVYTISAGIGRRTQQGDFVEIDTSQVETLASRTGGRFFKAQNASAVAGVYAFIDQLEKARLDDPRYRLEERFLLFLVAGLLLLFFGRLLGSTVLEVLP